MFTTSSLLNDGKGKKKVVRSAHGREQYTQLQEDEVDVTPYSSLQDEQQEHKYAAEVDLLRDPPQQQSQLPSRHQVRVQQYEPLYPPAPPASLSLTAEAVTTSFDHRLIQPPRDIVSSVVLEQPVSSELRTLITQTSLHDEDSRQQAAKIVAAFNASVKTSAVTTTSMWGRGERLNPNEFMLVHRNKVAELAAFNKYKIATTITGPGTVVEKIGKFQQNEPFFGAHGSYVVNVPQGKYAKIWRGNKPVLLGEGPHVIHDTTLKFAENRFDAARDFIDQNPASNHINHGAINIVNVPPGQVAKINIRGKPYILEHRAEPYAFNVQNFQFGGLVSQATPHIEHGNIHIIRVPQGKYAKVTVGGEAQLLKPRAEPYVFETPYFEWNNFVNQTENYIGHGKKHILRVPPGTVGKVTVNGQPQLLESRAEPYEFDTLYFNLVGPRNEQGQINCFEPSTSRLITNGNLKRLIPRTGEVAITYDNGQLKVIPPSESSEPVIIDSATHDVDPHFLPIGIKTLIFPSEDTKAEKRKDNSKATEDEIAYEVFTTKDSLRVGVKLMVAYEISDPALAMRRLGSTQDILEHIENCAVVDMGKAIQKCSSQEFLSFYQTKPRNGHEDKEAESGMPSAPRAEHFQDEVKNQLSVDLAEYGIKLVRLNVETPKVLDETIAKQMGSQSIATAQASAKEAALDTNFAIARREAQQAAEVARIKQEQENNSKTSAARATFDATQLLKTAEVSAQVAVMELANQMAISKAKNDLEAAKLRATVVQTDAAAENEKVRLQGQRLHDYPELLQLELARMQFEALAKTRPSVNLNVTSEEMRNFSAMSMNPFMMFGNSLARATAPGAQHGVTMQTAAMPLQQQAMQSAPNSPRSPRLFNATTATPVLGLAAVTNSEMESKYQGSDVQSTIDGGQVRASSMTLS
jgi:hypothetical protein